MISCKDVKKKKQTLERLRMMYVCVYESRVYSRVASY